MYWNILCSLFVYTPIIEYFPKKQFYNFCLSFGLVGLVSKKKTKPLFKKKSLWTTGQLVKQHLGLGHENQFYQQAPNQINVSCNFKIGSKVVTQLPRMIKCFDKALFLDTFCLNIFVFFTFLPTFWRCVSFTLLEYLT